MPDWLIWVLVFWFVLGCGTGCRRGYRRLEARRHGPAGEDALNPAAGAGALGASGHGPGLPGEPLAEPAAAAAERPAAVPRGAPGTSAGGPAAPEAASRTVKPPEETRLQALQRRFVEGELTLEEYEAELDRLDRDELGRYR